MALITVSPQAKFPYIQKGFRLEVQAQVSKKVGPPSCTASQQGARTGFDPFDLLSL